MANLREALARRADLPADILAGAMRITLTGSERVLVENHRGLLAYTDALVEVNGRGLRLRVRGEKLLLRAMDGEMLLVTGRIFGIDLE